MTALEIMQAVGNGSLTPEEGQRMITSLAKATTRRKATVKLGNKRNVVVKLGSQMRYPTTLYANQWLELAEFMPQILKFIEENKSRLAFEASDDESLAA